MVKFNNIALRYKLILGFLLIVILNGLTGAFELSLIKELGTLVRQTYDNALMSGTFALASKYDYAQYNLDVQSALLSETPAEFKASSLRSRRMLKTLKDDLEVFKERSLEPKTAEKVNDLLEQIEKVDASRAELFREKETLLTSGRTGTQSDLLVKKWAALPETKILYRSLTASYDDAAELGYKFRLESDERIEKATKLTVTVLAAALFLSLVLSVMLSLIIINPLSKLRDVCREIAGGNFSIRSGITGKDEFGTLSSVFNLMLGNIDDKTQSMSSLLNTIPFALFYFESDGSISTERSLSTDKLLPGFGQHKTLEDFFTHHGIAVEDLEGIRKAMFENAIPFNSAAYLMPRLITVGEGSKQKLISLSYHPKKNQNKKLERVIILGEDITEKERANARTRELTERVERVSKVSADLPGFKEFLSGAESLFQTISVRIKNGTPADLTDVLRDLHSLKGLLGVYSFETVAGKVHDLETSLSENKSQSIELKPIKALFNMQIEDLNSILALSAEDDLIFLDNQKVHQLKEEVRASQDMRLQKIILELDRFPFSRVFSKFSAHAVNVAKKLEDKQVEVIVEDSSDVSYEEIKRIDPVLIHVLNNSVDHGIEASEDRLSVQKSEKGRIRVKCNRNPDSSLTFIISDDGKGINGELLFEKAVKSGIVSSESPMSMDEKNNLVFAAGLSSKSEASIFSGRGVGLDAVKAHLESLGGTIRLETVVGFGTTFEINIPSTGAVS